MTIYDTLRDMLINHGVITEYTDAQLDNFILEAKLLIDTPFVNNSQIEEYKTDWTGDVYYTNEYPLIKSSVTVIINNTVIIPEHVTSDGIIYLDKTYTGDLKCTYTIGLSNEDITNYLLPIVVCLIEDKEGLNIASVGEGDINISYNNATGYTSKTLDTLIQNLRDKYSARVRLI